MPAKYVTQLRRHAIEYDKADAKATAAEDAAVLACKVASELRAAADKIGRSIDRDVMPMAPNNPKRLFPSPSSERIREQRVISDQVADIAARF